MGTATEHYKIGGYLDRRSFWLSNTPSAAQLEMPYVCTEAGALYGERGFVTERDGKDSYLLFYTFGGTGLVRQGKRTAIVRHGQMLLLDCRTPQSYGTDPKSDRWYHLWAHVQGAGAEATARRLGVPALAAVSVPRSRVQPYWDTILFRRVTGQTMRAYLTSKRIKTAQHLLATDERSIAQIAARLRFCDQSYFTQVFRRQTGLTPRQYRDANRR